MNFKNFLLTVLGNQKGELDLGSSEQEHVSESDNQNDGEDLSVEGLLASFESEEGSEQTEESQPNEELSEEGDLESQLENLDSQAVDADGVLAQINELGFIHNGLPFEVEDMDTLKEYISKGKDYTHKTQEVADMRKTAEAEFQTERDGIASEREAFQTERAQHEEILNQYSILQNTLAEISRDAPDLFDELNGYYTQHESRMGAGNPALTKMESKIAELEKQLAGNRETETNKKLDDVKETWNTELKDLQASYAPKLKSLGIRPDWAKVRDVWAADTTNKMTVKAALFAEHGEAIQKALSNKAKMSETRAKVARAGSKPKEEEEPIFGMETGNSYEKEAFEIMKGL